MGRSWRRGSASRARAARRQQLRRHVRRRPPPRRGQKRHARCGGRAYRAQPQVEAVFTAAEIAATPVPTGPPDDWSLIERVRESYYPGRSGDFYVILKKDVTPIADTSHGFVATHGSPWDYDRRVPILFWRPVQGRDGASAGGDGRHHADARGADRASARRRARSTAIASKGTPAFLSAAAKRLKTRAFLSLPFGHEAAV